MDQKQQAAFLDLLDNVEQSLDGIPEVSKDITVFPNPTHDLVTLSRVIPHMYVIKGTGQIVKSMQGVQEVDLGDLPAGVYTLRTQELDDRINILRIVKH